ncbi:HlyD family efflux transporter periplasmic adaptor subunit [Gimibacter soli]|uniref:Efflux RND transporter periplasmic adaptor subunit n=1 Tax=Gimibacter soli TaxID=3024400 RepID=A0AAE9XSS8_9PROT|nr:HlyD family efflux transporter periplasmic adaptor subunit [Gimibacter soli]WCL55676.1 efflux RND transporter periplasmic adaptor subunit [Gimibacter soli]
MTDADNKANDSAALPDSDADATLARRRTRKRLMVGFLLVVAAVGAGWTSWWYLVGSHYVETDNAYVEASLVHVTPLVEGTVMDVPVNDTQLVRKGEVLVTLDKADAELALANAEARLASAERRVRQAFAAVETVRAQIKAREADVTRTKVDLDRRQKLAKSGAVSGDELTAASNAFANATAALDAAKRQLEAELVYVEGTDVEHHPEVAAARAARDQVLLDLDRTIIRAAESGVIARLTAQPGQHVAVGAALMQIVPLSDVYVNANFKEAQLERVHTGQKVTLWADIYGDEVVYHGTVEGLGAGTGAAFSLIPAQNATGNWIKVVQRLPVRIALDAAEVASHPLRVGLSMTAKIQLDD